jgi:hypothetical protein
MKSGAASPFQTARDVAAGVAGGAVPLVGMTLGESKEEMNQRRAAIQRATGGDPNSSGYSLGSFGTQFGLLAGAGNVLGGGARALGAAPEVISALQAGGFASKAPWWARAAGGGAGGALSGGMMEPSEPASGGAGGAVLGATASMLLPYLGAKAMGVVNALSPRHAQNVINSIYSKAFNNDPAKIQMAESLAAQGRNRRTDPQ